jgi:hypothetical protein
MKLFDDKVRIDIAPSKHIDNTYNFCDRNAQPKVEKIRNILNHWFSRYPDDEKIELRRRFETTFNDALFELFLYELFLKQGFAISIHPEVPHTTKRPDFLLSKNGIEIYLEAKVSTGKSDKEKSNENRIDCFYDSLNSTDSPNFFLGIKELIFKTEKQPSTKKLIQYLERELKKYDADEITKQHLSVNSFVDLTQIIFDNDDIHISFFLIPKSLTLRGDTRIRPIGIYPATTFWGGSEDSIKSSLEKKATRYGNLDKPYIICINSTNDIMTNEYDAMDAVWGSLQISFSTNPNNRDEKLTRGNNGFFLGNKGVQHTGVNGVLITRMNLSSIQNPEYWLHKHPFAKYNLDFNIMELDYYSVSSNQIIKVERKSVGEILSLPKEWINF